MPHDVRPDTGQPSPAQLATFVVACGLLGLAMLASHPLARTVLQRAVAGHLKAGRYWYWRRGRFPI